jgi:cell division protease FtsH
LIDHAYKEAERLLNENRSLLDKISEALLEFETLDAQHIKDLIEHGEMKDPPNPPEPPVIPNDLQKERTPESTEEKNRGEDGSLVSAFS